MRRAQTAAQSVVDTYADVLSAAYTGHMAAKLGLQEYHKPLAVGLVTLMQEDKADFTNTFRCRLLPHLVNNCNGSAGREVHDNLSMTRVVHMCGADCTAAQKLDRAPLHVPRALASVGVEDSPGSIPQALAGVRSSFGRTQLHQQCT